MATCTDKLRQGQRHAEFSSTASASHRAGTGLGGIAPTCLRRAVGASTACPSPKKVQLQAWAEHDEVSRHPLLPCMMLVVHERQHLLLLFHFSMWVALDISFMVSLDCADQASVAIEVEGRTEDHGTVLLLSQSSTKCRSATSTQAAAPGICWYCQTSIQAGAHVPESCWYCQSCGHAANKDCCSYCTPPAELDALIAALPSAQYSVSPVSNAPKSCPEMSPKRSSLDVLLGSPFAAEVFGSPGSSPKQPAPLAQGTTHSACAAPALMPDNPAEAAPCALLPERKQTGDQGKPCSQAAAEISAQRDASGGSVEDHTHTCPADTIPLLPFKNAVVATEGTATLAQNPESRACLSASTAHPPGPHPTLLNPGWQLLRAPCAQATPFWHLSADISGHGQDVGGEAVENNHERPEHARQRASTWN